VEVGAVGRAHISVVDEHIKLQRGQHFGGKDLHSAKVGEVKRKGMHTLGTRSHQSLSLILMMAIGEIDVMDAFFSELLYEASAKAG
jgi:hypothetical protein